jgi:hypothetical protein
LLVVVIPGLGLLSEMLSWWSGEGDQGPHSFRGRLEQDEPTLQTHQKKNVRNGRPLCARIPLSEPEQCARWTKGVNPAGDASKKECIAGLPSSLSPETSSLAAAAWEKKIMSGGRWAARKRFPSRAVCFRVHWNRLSVASRGQRRDGMPLGGMHRDTENRAPCMRASTTWFSIFHWRRLSIEHVGL